MKFKVGDNVRVLVEKSALFGKDCVVVGVEGSMMYPYEVECNVGYSVYKEEDLQLIEEPKESLIDELVNDFDKPKLIKDERLNRLEELTTALNILGSLGIELDVKIHAEVNGKKIEL